MIDFYSRINQLTAVQQTQLAKSLPPLSFDQQGLWIQEQLDPGNPGFIICQVFRMTGTLNIAALEQGLNTINLRHEALRTAFMMVDNQPFQVIYPHHTTSLPIIDLSDYSYTVQESEIAKFLEHETVKPFDLSHGLVWRYYLLKTNQKEHILVITIHHIVFDSWSVKVLLMELSVLYNASISGKPPLLPKLAFQYADFARWQRKSLRQETMQDLVIYWQRQLADMPPPIQLPIRRPYVQLTHVNGVTSTYTIQGSLVKDLKAFCRNQGITLFVILLTIFKILIHSYTKKNDIIIGTNIANRNLLETETLIGFFINQLLLRTKITGDPNFIELLHHVRSTTLSAYSHMDLPFSSLVEALNIDRGNFDVPLVEVKFSFQKTAETTLDLRGLQTSIVPVKNRGTNNQLILNILEIGHELTEIWEYNTDIYNSSDIEQMSNRFRYILTHVINHPSLRLSEILKVVSDFFQLQNRLVVDERRAIRQQKLHNVRIRGNSIIDPDNTVSGS